MLQGALMILSPYNMWLGDLGILYYSLLDQGVLRGDMPGPL